MGFAIEQFPWAVLLAIFSAEAGIMFFYSPSQIVSVSDVKFLRLEALKYIYVIHKYTFLTTLRLNQRPSLRDALAKWHKPSLTGLSYTPRITDKVSILPVHLQVITNRQGPYRQ
jgi:hypothetical protein